jgi:hypothetical protein
LIRFEITDDNCNNWGQSKLKFLNNWNDKLNKPGNAIGLRALETLMNNNAVNRDLWDNFADSDRLTTAESANLAASATLVLANEDQSWGDLPAMETLFPQTPANS